VWSICVFVFASAVALVSDWLLKYLVSASFGVGDLLVVCGWRLGVEVEVEVEDKDKDVETTRKSMSKKNPLPPRETPHRLFSYPSSLDPGVSRTCTGGLQCYPIERFITRPVGSMKQKVEHDLHLR
jgi:hypothetical protein